MIVLVMETPGFSGALASLCWGFEEWELGCTLAMTMPANPASGCGTMERLREWEDGTRLGV